VTPAGLDIIIVNHNTAALLDACLRSLEAHPPAEGANTIVVDNASHDGSVELVRKRHPAVQLLPLDRNVGFAAANNAAIRQSSAPLVLLLNSDTLVPDGAIDTLIGRLRSTGAAVAGPRLVDGDGRPEISFGSMLSPLAELRQAFRMRRARSRSARAGQAVARLLTEERQVDWVTGACLLVTRTAAVDAGLLDERYFMYEEDVDFCAALRARGGTILFTPRAEIVHLGGRSLPDTARKREWYDRSHLAFYEKHAPHWVGLLRWWTGRR